MYVNNVYAQIECVELVYGLFLKGINSQSYLGLPWVLLEVQTCLNYWPKRFDSVPKSL